MITEVLRKESERQRQEGIREGIKQGVKQGIESIIIQMIKLGVKEDMICSYTNTSKEELEKIKSKI